MNVNICWTSSDSDRIREAAKKNHKILCKDFFYNRGVVEDSYKTCVYLQNYHWFKSHNYSLEFFQMKFNINSNRSIKYVYSNEEIIVKRENKKKIETFK